MSKKHTRTIEDLFDLFSESLSPADVISAKLMSQISTAITKERMKLSMNQADFAKHIDATQSLVSRWEHGDYNFSIRKIAEIAASLNLDVNFLFCNFTEHKTSDFYSGTSYGAKVIRYTRSGKTDSTKMYTGVQDTNTTLLKPTIKEEEKYVTIR